MMYLKPILNVLNNYLGRNRVGIGYATKTLLIGCKLLKLIFNFGRFVLNIFFIYMILQIEAMTLSHAISEKVCAGSDKRPWIR